MTFSMDFFSQGFGLVLCCFVAGLVVSFVLSVIRRVGWIL